jgi:peptide deformylase
MSILQINVYDDKILRKKTKPLVDVDFETVEFIQNMFETMRKASGIGLAATQVGSEKSFFIVDISSIEGYEKHKPLVAINPQIINKSDETKVIEEGCLSLPGLRMEVVRPAAITLKFFDTDLKEHRLDADELLARVIQHEYDHLEGILFFDHLPPDVQKKIRPELNKIKKRKVEVDYPIAELADYQLK